MKRTIVFTGGGSAGHVTANLALMARLREEEDWEIHYIGSKRGIERRLVDDFQQARYHVVATGKLRRYFALANITDVFKLLVGIVQAALHIFRIKPNVVFSLGGFVAVPVVIGAKWNGVPVVILEPDLNPGLANRISRRFARIMCTTFKGTVGNDRCADGKLVHVGPIVREELKYGSRARGIYACGFDSNKPVLLVMGGSQGADRINRIVRESLPKLLVSFQVVHICGHGKMDSAIRPDRRYMQLEYAHNELPDLLAMADLVVSRAGSGAIHELLLLRKPMLLIPHANGGSRLGQTANAQSFRDAGYAELLNEEGMTSQAFLEAVENAYLKRRSFVDRMKNTDMGDAAGKVIDLIRTAAGVRKGRGL
ncbi:undecaprenyldiphospho-muramoylpentapeptide beta-N-acetylglucosaminyltransferase [Paenibacillus oralis]|uniref:UDP-N-acetylglucosamine--N-acetylmuramyl-(pentapeptide) pyrophosphoryl-undecaprenol N-acetylglucosamine transferase n=1 Tax=Paenibacillus oralis TaxID=2490856 RepID=A0A3P3UA76_9BACL|nr:undecaprenyldiphospho-muramoylpentapeptide beta-N-acetylglucosaminyltransferase [Paenibacillus oralis]RRJ67257.1 undecaprenyldiphospho-muramoylpentapeptide beta-N-acetylglucosaminyltransferase [Paenibacillus oralis]